MSLSVCVVWAAGSAAPGTLLTSEVTGRGPLGSSVQDRVSAPARWPLSRLQRSVARVLARRDLRKLEEYLNRVVPDVSDHLAHVNSNLLEKVQLSRIMPCWSGQNLARLDKYMTKVIKDLRVDRIRAIVALNIAALFLGRWLDGPVHGIDISVQGDEFPDHDARLSLLLLKGS